MKRINRSTWLPLALLVYLAVIAYMSRSRVNDGDGLFYFGVIIFSLIVIGLLHWALRKKGQ
ncbi:MAG: hypothetical protein IJ808_00250 [Muribaculaceae bacterium]|nr:hypothetical protein [Muribaculaceae bacterium]